MLEVRALAARRGEATLFEGLSFRVAPGQALIVTGANGTGKTTLLRILAGLTLPFSGEVRLHGEAVAPYAPELRQQVLYSGHLPALKDELSAEENLVSLVALGGERTAPEDARAALAAVGLDAQRALPARVLSQGQRRRVGLARLPLLRRALWLLDEPATALDAQGTAHLAMTIRQHLAGGGAVVAATHQGLDLPETNVQSLALA
jgi:heme exporter protein A